MTPLLWQLALAMPQGCGHPAGHQHGGKQHDDFNLPDLPKTDVLGLTSLINSLSKSISNSTHLSQRRLFDVEVAHIESHPEKL